MRPALAACASSVRRGPLLGFDLLQVVGPVQESSVPGHAAIPLRRSSQIHPAPMNLIRLQIHPQHLASFKAVAPVLSLLTGGVIAAWVYFSVASPQRVGHYLTLHQVLETLSIAVSALVFAVGWKAHSLNPQRNVLILACGTSYYSGCTAKYWIEALAGLPCSVEVASEYRYRAAYALSLIHI